MADEDIVISGISAYFPQADHIREFKEKLYAGVDFLTDDDTRWPRGILGAPHHSGMIRDLSHFDAQFFNIHPKQAQALDPQVRLLLETSYEAILDAGYDPAELRGESVGVFIGNSGSETSYAYNVESKPDKFQLLGCTMTMLANRVSYYLGFHGPSFTLDTACSSTMTAFNQAVVALRSGQCSAAIVGGCSLLINPSTSAGFARLGMLCSDGKLKAFDSSGNGYVRGETVGAVFLQRKPNARRIYAKVINTRANADGYKPEGITYPSGKTQGMLLRDIYAEANVDPRKVGYIEAHGTGTKAGDTQELGAISGFFCKPGRERPLKVGSVKSNVGHAEAASGIPSLAKVILAMETGIIAANRNYTKGLAEIPALHDGRIEVVDRPMAMPEGPVGISSFGFGGANVHVILEKNGGLHVDDFPREKPDLPRLVLMAGREKGSLESTLDQVEAEGPYPDSAYALLNRVGRRSVSQFPFRGFAVVPVDGQGKAVVKEVHPAPFSKRPLWFVFTGIGCQWGGIARQMMQFDVFARSMRKSHEVLVPFGIDLIDLVTSEGPVDMTATTAFISIAAVQVALVDTLREMGITADAFVGHSTGEIACAYADGGLTAEQALLCAYWRGRCIQAEDPPKGAMAAVGLTLDQATQRCRDGVVLACDNAEDSVTVSGPADAVATLVEELRSEKVFAKEVDSLGVAFHSGLMKKIGPPMLEVLKKVIPDPKPRSERWISTSVPESRWQEPMAQLNSAEYQVNNFLSPVLFREALKHAPSNAIFLEVAPHCLLQAILLRAVDKGATCLGVMKRNADNLTYFLSALGKLHSLGVDLDPSPLFPSVPWPVPRGTPNISHLVSWDHTQKWPPVAWNEFPWARVTEQVFDIDLEANEEDAYLKGHIISGRLVLPACACIVFAWRCFSIRYGKEFEKLPVVFEDLTFHRPGVVSRTGSTRILANVLHTSGEFEVSESGSLLATGRIRLLDESDRLGHQELPVVPPFDANYELSSEDLYKELNLRGYNYEGAFKSLLAGSAKGTSVRLKWENNWVTFLDGVLQIGLFKVIDRTFCLPTRIKKCVIDTELHARITKEGGNKGVPAISDLHLDIVRAGGVVLHDMEVNVAPKRPVQQTPMLEDHRFVPYVDDELERQDREACVKEYLDACSFIAKHILDSYAGRKGQAFDHITDLRAAPEEVVKYCPKNAKEEQGLLTILKDILDEANRSQSSLEATVQSILAARKEAIEKDLINTVLLKDEPLGCLLDIVTENNDFKKIRIVEIATEGTKLLLPHRIVPLLYRSSGIIKIEYTVAVESLDGFAVENLPENVRMITWNPASSNIGELPESDLIVAHSFTAAAAEIEALAGTISRHCKERCFIMLAYRNSLCPAESLLTAVDPDLIRLYDTQDVKSAFSPHGVQEVAFKSNNLSSLLLLRKTSLPIEADKQVVIRVNKESFAWVDTLRDTCIKYASRPQGHNIWMLAEDVGTSGVVGLTACLLKETGGSHIRCVFDASLGGPSKVEDFDPSNPAYKQMLERDLVMNVYKDGQWGSYRHILQAGAEQLDSGSSTLTEYAYLNMRTFGDLSSLEWYESPLRHVALPSDSLLCSVYYAPLNFRDVMLATGKLPPEAPSSDEPTFVCPLGLEFSGRDSNGRRVMGGVPGSGMATVVAADPWFLWEVPDAWGLEEAATVPTAYATAYYALLVRGNMRPGESVLIHSGSGGVGQAAISVALSMGCTVYTTVGSQEKRDFLKRRFPQLGDRNIANSRNLSFRDHVLLETNGKGVDLVLNSLAGEKLKASLRCLAPHGRFLEIGMFDLAKNTDLGMAALMKNVSFCVVHIDALHFNTPTAIQEKRRVCELLREGVATGTVRPLSSVVFPRTKAEEAFRFMASGKHIGKVVLEIRPEETRAADAPVAPLQVEAVTRAYFYAHKAYVIAGGLGGFGLELADWMITRGCKKLLLSSRRGVRTGYQQLCLGRWQRMGAEVLVTNADASTITGAKRLLSEAEAMGPIGGIFNLAMVLHDGLIENQTAESFEEVFIPKGCGTQCLDELSRVMCPDLDYFVAFSSLSSGRGNIGQTNYGYANSVMERICEQRVASGLHGLAIQWGAIDDVGYVHESSAKVNLSGTVPQRISSCLEVMDRFLRLNYPVMSSVVKEDAYSSTATQVKRDLVQAVLHILGVKDPSRKDPNMRLGELGMDSLIGVEVKQTIERDYDVSLSMQQVQDLTIKNLQEIAARGPGGDMRAADEKSSKKVNESSRALQMQQLMLARSFLTEEMFVEMNGLKGDCPLFLMHPFEGSVAALMEMAGHLPVRTVGVQRTSETPLQSIEETAASYVQRLLDVQLSGPYNLVGYSYGAMLAFEIAVQLQASGAAVQSLTLLDGGARYGRQHWAVQRFGLPDIGETAQELSFFSRFIAHYINIDEAEARDRINRFSSWDEKRDAVVDMLRKNIPGLREHPRDLAAGIRVAFDTVKAVTNHKPRTKFRGNVLLLKSSNATLVSRDLPQDYGLSEYVDGNFEVNVIEGTHETFVLGPGARECANAICQQLKK
ncbi:fatty acid synthase-like [Haemaphysalis longicornis]